MKTVICHDIFGQKKEIPANQLIFRPAVYGIFIENQQVLLLEEPQSSLWQLPGGPLASHHPPIQALLTFFRLQTGLIVNPGPMLFVEDRYVLDGDGQAWQHSALYYAVRRPVGANAGLATGKSTAVFDWLSLRDIKRESLQFGYEAIQAGYLQLTLSA